jgi:hypothetical protein
MLTQRYRTVLLSAVLLCASQAGAQSDPGREEWVQLFNGKDLSGWTVKINGYDLGDNFGNTFRVEDGMLKVSYDQYTDFGERFGHIFHQQKFSHYVVAVEYRFAGDQVPGGPAWARRNSGVMVHSQAPETMGVNQNFPISIEVQLLGGLGEGTRTTANLCTPGTHVVMDAKLLTRHCTASTSATFDGDQWVRVETVVLGDSQIRHKVNGETVLTYEMPQIGGEVVNGFDPLIKQDGKLLNEGYISLQSESHPVHFRKVELLNLAGCIDPKAKNYKSYHVKSEPSQCSY